MPSKHWAASWWAGAPTTSTLPAQAAIERLGAKKDGVLRGHALRRDGTIRDTVMYSMRAASGRRSRRSLLYLLDKTAHTDRQETPC